MSYLPLQCCQRSKPSPRGVVWLYMVRIVSPLACDDYVSRRLSHKLESLRVESQVAMQCKISMLRFCFAQKIDHLLRCFPPSLTSDLKYYDALKISVFSKILGI